MEAKKINMNAKDEKDFEELCSTTWESLYSFVYFKVQNREEAEDITQETYIKAISYIKKNRVNIDKIMGFLKVVSLNVLRDKWRKGKRQGKLISIENMNPLDAASEDPTESFGQREVIENAMMLLSEEQRTVVELRILKGFSVIDTANKMNQSESNVRVLQYRAIKKLSKLLKSEF
jgi:RNA polymerase sigma-70 factor (ECF subfamily)